MQDCSARITFPSFVRSSLASVFLSFKGASVHLSPLRPSCLGHTQLSSLPLLLVRASSLPRGRWILKATWTHESVSSLQLVHPIQTNRWDGLFPDKAHLFLSLDLFPLSPCHLHLAGPKKSNCRCSHGHPPIGASQPPAFQPKIPGRRLVSSDLLVTKI